MKLKLTADERCILLNYGHLVILRMVQPQPLYDDDYGMYESIYERDGDFILDSAARPGKYQEQPIHPPCRVGDVIGKGKVAKVTTEAAKIERLGQIIWFWRIIIEKDVKSERNRKNPSNL